MIKIFNSVFEVSLRILIILASDQNVTYTVERIAGIDFIVLNARSFGLSDYNLHGDSEFRLAEFATRRDLVKKALNELIFDGLVKIKSTNNGFCYEICVEGKEYCAEFDSEYTDEYYRILVRVLSFCQNRTDRELLSLINQ